MDIATSPLGVEGIPFARLSGIQYHYVSIHFIEEFGRPRPSQEVQYHCSLYEEIATTLFKKTNGGNTLLGSLGNQL